ncbi:Crp/Fnr family transcriptional regulator [Pinibacter aurantiacus]|uniref:Crp/Fnr family transcriptional regulator n=1 Tax=Pinibacter aurantiacus TaxID=2851599 RepID=A0A9E2SEG8_9BACT|nr:Crp/Fnr family transcriptional regulator [Pinibacter aurantiacus]MBV4360627.1 Crp/Fnr family transcriptional regulator [Pinibacter aurantiacus]
MDSLLQAIRSYAPISQAEGEYFYSFFRKVKYKKNTLLLEEGSVAHEVFFVEKGCLRQFFFTEKGVEKTCNFVFEQEFLTDLESFSRQTRATTNIIALEPTECLVTTCKDLVECMAASPAVASFFNVIVENVATANIRRIQSLLSQSPEQQFEVLLQNSPKILQRVPQRYIAQYLGIAPESLSRIRKRALVAAKS